MKTILYISQSAEEPDANGLPKSLASIIVNSRKKNTAFNLRSMLCHYQGRYMQIVEGEDVYVDDLMNSIQRDARHKNIHVLIDSVISQPLIGSQNFKVLAPQDNNAYLIKFINKHLPQKYPSAATVEEIMTGLSKLQKNKRANKYQNNLLSLSGWPAFDVVTPTRELLELCAMLTTTQLAFADLEDKNPYQSSDTLVKTLDELATLGLLNKEFLPEDAAKRSSMGGGFFKRMRNFINRVEA